MCPSNVIAKHSSAERRWHTMAISTQQTSIDNSIPYPIGEKIESKSRA